jgi:2-dehydro-3-deoxyglucarate aldolase/4-hydroxy-2-oxoheptanedioate aldolase
MPSRDSLKQRIRKGEVVIGVSAPITADRQRLEDILSRDTYDFVSVDSQHAAFNEDRLVQFCAIAEELDIPVQFRIKHTRHAYLIGNLLDLGPSGVEIPQVEDEATVDEALTYFYYPQFGNRSWGGTARRGIQGRDDRRTYAEWWNNYGVLWLQIESIEAITKARKLAKPGVDCLSFGPSDLSFSLEAHPEHPFKTVDDCVRHVVQQLQGSPTKVCFRNYTPDLRNTYINMGVTVLLERPRS